jgi:hypothetical protein
LFGNHCKSHLKRVQMEGGGKEGGGERKALILKK